MKLTKITLENFRGFEHLEISLENGNQIIFIGNNGAGKTSILEAMAIGLSWLVARIHREQGSGRPLDDAAILNGKPEALITLNVTHQESPYQWTLTKTLKGRKKSRESHLTGATLLADFFRTALTTDAEKASLPLIAYYPVERGVLDIPLKIRERHTFGQLDGYDNALQGVDFRRFFEWFREREDSENESATKWMDDFLEILAESDVKDQDQLWDKLKQRHSSQRDRQLTAVRSAIISCIPGFSNLRIQRRPRLRMMVNKEGHPLDVGQLSQGEKSLMALVGDIARRLAMMNPGLTNPLEGEGIVLIDEVDLHLHPRWQRTIIGNLAQIFPNCQFILTTHSPIIISQERDSCGFVLSDGEVTPLGHTYGLDVNLVLLQEMETAIRNPIIQEKIDGLLHAIHDGKVEQAQSQLKELEQSLPADHIELSKARLLLWRLGLRRGKSPVDPGQVDQTLPTLGEPNEKD